MPIIPDLGVIFAILVLLFFLRGLATLAVKLLSSSASFASSAVKLWGLSRPRQEFLPHLLVNRLEIARDPRGVEKR